MKKLIFFFVTVGVCLWMTGTVGAALTVPNEIQQPGTQPLQVGNLESPDKCDNCHGGYNPAVEPAFNWRGSMMANAGRDPIFWATLAIAEQDFDGSGDLCIRCHSTAGWYAGRSTPTDGSGLTASDADGVDCDTCHKMTNTGNSEWLGLMISPFIANNEQTPATGYFGTGMLSLWAGAEKLGPYLDPDARHQFLESDFHRDVSFCGSCHDVSNPAVGDLAPNHGTQATADPVVASGILGTALETKAAFNNFPFQYGIVERTFSEYMAGGLSKTLVSNYASLPADLKAGAVKAAFDSAKGNYVDGDARYFSCQTCHVPATTGAGCNKAGVQTRTDLPMHDMTGGNYWIPDAIQWQDTNGLLRLGGGLTTTQNSALDAGQVRATNQLLMATTLQVTENTLKVTNLTGHKLISGYPEGRRMWLNIKWYDSGNALLREDGAYGVVASVNSSPVKSILNLSDPNTKIYEAHYGMTQDWAAKLISLGYASNIALGYDRITGAVNYTLGQLAAENPGSAHETFHFVLNNTVIKDNRIPPYGFDYEEARKRNALPVPLTQYRNSDGSYRYWDEVVLNPPGGATHAVINMMYQPTSWEYIQFLYLGNNGSNAFLANEGVNMLNAWLNTGMAEPMVMASAQWNAVPSLPGAFSKISPSDGATGISTTPTLTWGSSTGSASYEYCYDTTNDNACAAWTSTGTSKTATLSGLSNSTTYYWQVRSSNGVGTTYADAGSYWSFTSLTTPPAAFSKTSPADGATSVSTSPSLSWGASTGAASYEYCYDTTNDNACSVWTSNGTSTTKALSGLSEGTTYYWHVRALNSGGTTYSNASPTAFWSFTTLTTPPGAFSKTSPADGATGVSTSPSLSWGASTGAASYEYCYDTTNDNECGTSWISNGSSISVDLSGLNTGRIFYWQVRSINASGSTVANEGSWFSFTTVPTFSDVQLTYWAWDWIERLYRAGITTGCIINPIMQYCPENPVTRAEMAVFLERGKRGAGYIPPVATGIFNDVVITHWAASWIEQLYADGITSGCNVSPLRYCPENPVTRDQMAVFLLRAKYGSGYAPPLPTGIFSDVPTTHWAAGWIEKLYADGITTGCSTTPLKYCPYDPVKRAEMAVFLVRTFSLP